MSLKSELGTLQMEYFDIFEPTCLQTLRITANNVKFLIYKNNTYIATKKRHYSIDQLQEEYGGGFYKIVAKTIDNNKYVTQQSVSVADPDEIKKWLSRSN